MSIEKFVSIAENFDFTVHEYEEGGALRGYELETWTNGGVNMLLFIDCRDCPEVSMEFVVEELESSVNAFSVDEEIDLHRQGEAYRNAFTIGESLADFEEYKTRLGDLLEAVKNAHNQRTTQKRHINLDVCQPHDGKKIFCPDCGKQTTIEFNTARCSFCGWMCAGAELDELFFD